MSRIGFLPYLCVHILALSVGLFSCLPAALYRPTGSEQTASLDGTIDSVGRSSGRSSNTDSLKIEFIEYIVLGVIVLFLVALLFLLRYLLRFKNRCPNFCCGWFPTPEVVSATPEKQHPTMIAPLQADALQSKFAELDVQPPTDSDQH